MIVFIFKFLALLHAIYFLGNAYAAYKFSRLQHRWAPYLAIAFTGNAVFGLASVFTAGFGPRPAQVVWWAITLSILGRLAKVAGITVLVLFLLGYLNGGAKNEDTK